MTAEPMRFCALLFAGDDKATPDLTALTVARALADQSGTTAHALVIGPQRAQALENAMALGLDDIVVCAGMDAAEPWQPGQILALLADMLQASPPGRAADPNVLYLVSADPLHEEVAARLAARLGAVPLGRVQSIGIGASGEVTAVRSAYGGRLRATQRVQTGPATASVRAGATAPGDNAVTKRNPTAVHEIAVPIADESAFEIVACSQAEIHAPVDGASIVVSGGRGIGDPAGFELLYDIALQLDGAVGASLPAVDAGLAPVARQVGQSGKYVRPDIYLAVGISGTPQHMAGIDPLTRVVAINADPEAPIFGMSRVGIVGDWKQILPALKRTLSE
ncbi:MAG: electron transfer flavoprotein subunit alpha/FixB family protein [Burkholderiales bacterium]